ncbi:hypothetical protein [Deinococcus kurensis]|uniref:hypothetical protein n=1 Tax=Deinococcus kurensis TaxID=2662757 RepID=UPI0012D2F978|nr:hypothetical protein [Deinococcus kurensis]
MTLSVPRAGGVPVARARVRTETRSVARPVTPDLDAAVRAFADRHPDLRTGRSKRQFILPRDARPECAALAARVYAVAPEARSPVAQVVYQYYRSNLAHLDEVQWRGAPVQRVTALKLLGALVAAQPELLDAPGLVRERLSASEWRTVELLRDLLPLFPAAGASARERLFLDVAGCL